MRILITGHMGYIGPAVIRQLRSSYPGAIISGLDIGFFERCLSAPNEVMPECLPDRQWFADIRKCPNEALRGVDVVVHLAAISNEGAGNAFENAACEINYLATIELAKKAKAMGAAHFIYASSCNMYSFEDGRPATEISPLTPITPYERSMIYSEKRLSDMADADFFITSMRFATACGMSERLRLDLDLNHFVASAITSGRITVSGDGTKWTPHINIWDIARAIDWAVGRGPGKGTPAYLAVNTGSDEWNFTAAELAHAVAERLPGTEVYFSKKSQLHGGSCPVNFELFKKIAPDHQPVFNIKETLDELIDGIRAIDLRDDNLLRPFIRMEMLKEMREKGILTQGLEWAQTAAMEAVEV